MKHGFHSTWSMNTLRTPPSPRARDLAIEHPVEPVRRRAGTSRPNVERRKRRYQSKGSFFWMNSCARMSPSANPVNDVSAFISRGFSSSSSLCSSTPLRAGCRPYRRHQGGRRLVAVAPAATVAVDATATETALAKTEVGESGRWGTHLDGAHERAAAAAKHHLWGDGTCCRSRRDHRRHAHAHARMRDQRRA